tara:strand:+ start:132 stop:1541 length:1410 start_codon:yes stop_codon:yes gene_type:complete
MLNHTTGLNELVDQLAEEITVIKERKRKRTTEENKRFIHSLTKILTDVREGMSISPCYECIINLRSNFYSGPARYRDSNLAYKTHKTVFDSLLKLNLIRITQRGHYNRQTKIGKVTRYKPTEELKTRLTKLKGHPAIVLLPDLHTETVILRDKVGNSKTDIDYEETSETRLLRSNLKKINTVLAGHWADLELTQKQFTQLQERLLLDTDKLPVNFARRTIVRIFSNGSFLEGGRFYRGWWENVPSECRRYITLDSKRTHEYDYSQLNPHIIYALQNQELGSEDAYGRVLDGHHRDIVKQAFNAMLQAKRDLTRCPAKLDISELGMTWRELKTAILKAHQPIAHHFFTGIGNRLQYEDSCLAEDVMLSFAKIDAPALPVHDSFIMHHGYGGELEEKMRKAFFERYGRNISFKPELFKVVAKTELEDLSVESIAADREKYRDWNDRNDQWFKEGRKIRNQLRLQKDIYSAD